MRQQEYAALTAAQLAALVAEGEVTPAEVTRAALERIALLDGELHAFCTLDADAARAAAEAAMASTSSTSAPANGPLRGVPFAVKDLIATAGLRTAFGSPAYADFVPDRDDVAVERLRGAGGVLLGKTNTSEFGYSATGLNPLFPPTRNPWQPDLSPGGSSAGSAAAVASGLTPLALGSDGGGSIRLPAAFCGLVGFKPSMGRVPAYPGCRDERHPGVSSWETLEHIGPLTRTVQDAALGMSVLAGPDPRDRHSIPAGDVDWQAAAEPGPVRGLRVGYSPTLGYLRVDPEIRAVVDAAVGRLERDLGCTVEQADPGWADPAEGFWACVAGDTDLRGLRGLAAAHRDRMSDYVLDLVDTPWTAEQLTDGQSTRRAVANQAARFLSDHDVLVTPTCPVAAHPLEQAGPQGLTPGQWLGFLWPANLAGLPAISVPAGRLADGRWVGLQIVGRHLADATVLRLAAAFEQLSDRALNK